MNSISRIRTVTPPPSNVDLGTCKSSCDGEEIKGLFVPRAEDGRVFVRVGIRDPISYATFRVKFLVDTSARFTSVPRHLLYDRAFPSAAGRPQISFRDRFGLWRGRRYEAGLFLSSSDDGLFLGNLSVLVVSGDKTIDHGVLGVDALKLVVSVLDSTTLSFWQASGDREEAT